VRASSKKQAHTIVDSEKKQQNDHPTVAIMKSDVLYYRFSILLAG
jgi:hypothetical protein